jgi:hypothetical protein
MPGFFLRLVQRWLRWFLAGGFDALQLLIGLEEGALQAARDQGHMAEHGLAGFDRSLCRRHGLRTLPRELASIARWRPGRPDAARPGSGVIGPGGRHGFRQNPLVFRRAG